MTALDYIIECKLFQYSKENYNLIKECRELELMSLYLKSQGFITQDLPLFAESYSFLESGFFSETAGDTHLASIRANFKEKLKYFIERTRSKIVKLFERLIVFSKARLKNTTSTNDAAREIITKLKAARLTRNQEAAIQEIIESAIKHSGTSISAEQPEGFHKLPDEVLIAVSDRETRNKLAAALVNTQICADMSANKFKFALNERQLSMFFDEIVVVQPDDKTETVSKLLERFVAQNMDEGIRISNEPKAIERLLVSLEKSKQQLVDQISNDAEAEVEYGACYSRLVYDAVRVVGNSLELYGAVSNYRSLVISGLNKILQTP